MSRSKKSEEAQISLLDMLAPEPPAAEQSHPTPKSTRRAKTDKTAKPEKKSVKKPVEKAEPVKAEKTAKKTTAKPAPDPVAEKKKKAPVKAKTLPPEPVKKPSPIPKPQAKPPVKEAKKPEAKTSAAAKCDKPTRSIFIPKKWVNNGRVGWDGKEEVLYVTIGTTVYPGDMTEDPLKVLMHAKHFENCVSGKWKVTKRPSADRAWIEIEDETGNKVEPNKYWIF